MITLIKVNILTDDDQLPSWFRDELMKVLQTAVNDDPEGAEHGKVTLEWSLQTKMGAEVIAGTVKKSAPKKTVARR